MLHCWYGLTICCWRDPRLASAHFEGCMGCMGIAAKPEEGRHGVVAVLRTNRE